MTVNSLVLLKYGIIYTVYLNDQLYFTQLKNCLFNIVQNKAGGRSLGSGLEGVN